MEVCIDIKTKSLKCLSLKETNHQEQSSELDAFQIKCVYDVLRKAIELNLRLPTLLALVF